MGHISSITSATWGRDIYLNMRKRYIPKQNWVQFCSVRKDEKENRLWQDYQQYLPLLYIILWKIALLFFFFYKVLGILWLRLCLILHWQLKAQGQIWPIHRKCTEYCDMFRSASFLLPIYTPSLLFLFLHLSCPFLNQSTFCVFC